MMEDVLKRIGGFFTTSDSVDSVSLYEKYVKVLEAYDNLNKRIKRMAGEKEREAYGAENKALEPSFIAIDNLERMSESLDGTKMYKKSRNQVTKSIGVQIDTILDYLKNNYGVERVSSVGEQSDPTRHNILSELNSDKPKGQIVAVLQHGYTRDRKLIREAKVAVSSGVPNI